MHSAAALLLRHLRCLAGPTGAESCPDALLLEQFIERGDEQAFKTLVARHGPMVLSVCQRILNDLHHAEDAYQATFLMLARRARSVRRPRALAAWLHGVARHCALKARDTQARHRRHEGTALSSSSVDPHPDPLAEVSAREVLVILDEEIARLPEAYRMPLILCCLEGLSQEEAARRLGLSADSVRGRLERGRKRLRCRLEKRGLTLSAALAVLLAAETAKAAVPALLVHSTVKAALTGTGVSPMALALVKAVLRTVFLTKLKVVGGGVLLLGVLGLGVGFHSLRWAPSEPDSPAEPIAVVSLDQQPPLLISDPQSRVVEVTAVKKRVIRPNQVDLELVLRYDFFGGKGSQVKDASVHKHHGVLHDGEIVTGEGNPAVKLRGKGGITQADILDLTSRPFTVGALCRPTAGAGVVATLGDKNNGFSLYLKDKKPVFAVRVDGELAQVVGDDPMELDQWIHLAGGIDAKGKLWLLVNGWPAASGQGKLIARLPAAPFCVGADPGSPVGDYQSPFAWEGFLTDVRLYWGFLDRNENREALAEWADLPGCGCGKK
jgi:RNA polymerase sigma factor (sigma-70 family)